MLFSSALSLSSSLVSEFDETLSTVCMNFVAYLQSEHVAINKRTQCGVSKIRQHIAVDTTFGNISYN